MQREFLCRGISVCEEEFTELPVTMLLPNPRSQANTYCIHFGNITRLILNLQMSSSDVNASPERSLRSSQNDKSVSMVKKKSSEYGTPSSSPENGRKPRQLYIMTCVQI